LKDRVVVSLCMPEPISVIVHAEVMAVFGPERHIPVLAQMLHIELGVARFVMMTMNERLALPVASDKVMIVRHQLHHVVVQVLDRPHRSAALVGIQE